MIGTGLKLPLLVIILLASIISYYEICNMTQLFYRIVSKISTNHDFIPLWKQNHVYIKYYILRNYSSDKYNRNLRKQTKYGENRVKGLANDWVITIS